MAEPTSGAYEAPNAVYTTTLASQTGAKVTVTIEDSGALVDDICDAAEAAVRGVLATLSETDYLVSIRPLRPSAKPEGGAR